VNSERTTNDRLFQPCITRYRVAMVNEARLSSLPSDKYRVRAFCTRGEECKSSWEVDIAQAMQTFGDISFNELRQNLRCPQCDARITTTLTSLK
jgi:hypothetical protein